MGKRILLHACCGPCAIHPVQRLWEEGLEVVCLFYNPNVHPLQEYLRRREGMRQVMQRLQCRAIYKDEEYDPHKYLRNVVFREENRCCICYHMRLERTWSIARKGGFDYFSSTLLYSRFQKHETIASLGRDICGDSTTSFYYRDFREGWKEGIDKSQEWGIYRQQYCGCIYSEKERYARELDALIQKG